MSSSSRKPEPHPSLAALAITTMALVLAIVLQALGPMQALEEQIARWFGMLGGQMRPVSHIPVWGWTVLAAFGLSQAMLHVRGQWRRWVLSVSTLILSLAWVPMLALASFSVPFLAPSVALIWSALGSMIYAARHREPD